MPSGRQKHHVAQATHHVFPPRAGNTSRCAQRNRRSPAGCRGRRLSTSRRVLVLPRAKHIELPAGQYIEIAVCGNYIEFFGTVVPKNISSAARRNLYIFLRRIESSDTVAVCRDATPYRWREVKNEAFTFGTASFDVPQNVSRPPPADASLLPSGRQKHHVAPRAAHFTLRAAQHPPARCSGSFGSKVSVFLYKLEQVFVAYAVPLLQQRVGCQ